MYPALGARCLRGQVPAEAQLVARLVVRREHMCAFAPCFLRAQSNLFATTLLPLCGLPEVRQLLSSRLPFRLPFLSLPLSALRRHLDRGLQSGRDLSCSSWQMGGGHPFLRRHRHAVCSCCHPRGCRVSDLVVPELVVARGSLQAQRPGLRRVPAARFVDLLRRSSCAPSPGSLPGTGCPPAL